MWPHERAILDEIDARSRECVHVCTRARFGAPRRVIVAIIIITTIQHTNHCAFRALFAHAVAVNAHAYSGCEKCARRVRCLAYSRSAHIYTKHPVSRAQMPHSNRPRSAGGSFARSAAEAAAAAAAASHQHGSMRSSFKRLIKHGHNISADKHTQRTHELPAPLAAASEL